MTGTPGNIELFANYAITTVSLGGNTSPVSGTQETWTVASSSSFPAASATTGCFHIADPNLPSETILVTNVTGTTWTVIRGAEGTTPLAHGAPGFTVKQVVSAAVLRAMLVGIQPSGDTTGVTDTQTIQNALNLIGYAFVAPGKFYIGAVGSTANGLTVPGALSTATGGGVANGGGGALHGSGPGLTKMFYVGNGTAVYSHGTQVGGSSYQGIGARLTDFEVDGSLCGASATVIGVDVGDQYDILVQDVTISNFTSTGTTVNTGPNPLGAVGLNIANYVTLTEKCYVRRVAINNCGTPNTGGTVTPIQGGGAAIQMFSAAGATNTSHQYSEFDIHINQQPGQNGLVIARQGHLMNGRFVMRGNMNCPGVNNGCAAVVVGVGQQGHIQRMFLDIHVESDPVGSGTTQPFTIYYGGNADNTINRCWGRLQFLDGFQASNLPVATDGTFEWSGPIVGTEPTLVTPPTETFTSGSPLTYNGIDSMLYIKSTGGSISAVTINGISIPSNGLGGPFFIGAGYTITITFTGTLSNTFVPAGQGY